MAIIEYLLGRAVFPKEFKLFGGGPTSSKQVFDWYTPSHIIHGFIFYWLFHNIVYAILIEAGWEILENSPLIINRYRKTASEDYEGDTILNSVSDVLCMSFGFWLAFIIPIYLSILFIVAMELFALFAVRDNLTLNIIMLIYPFNRIKNWQKKTNL